MTIEREAVRGMGQAPATIKRGFSRLASSTPQTLPDVGAPQGAQIMGALVRASGILATEAGNRFQKKIAEDTVKQQSLAIRNLEPSDDATVAGYRAHSIIGMQNIVLSGSKEIEAEAATFTGTDDAWDEYMGSRFGEMHDNFLLEHPSLEGDIPALSAMNAIFGEQLPKLGMARISGKLEQEHTKRQQKFQDSILLRLDGLEGEELTLSADAIMDDGATTLKLTMQEREAMLGQAAINAAKGGDLRLIEYTKLFTGNQEASMFERVAGLQDAERQALSLNKTRNVAAIAEAKAINSADLTSGVIDAQGFYENGETINQRLGNAYTPDGMRAEVARVNKIRVEQQEIADWAENASPMNPVPPDKVKPVVSRIRDSYNKEAQEALAAMPDMPPEEKAQILRTAKRRADAELESKGLIDAVEREKFSNFLTVDTNTEAFTKDQLPPEIQSSLDDFYDKSDGGQIDYSNPKVMAFAKNNRIFLSMGKTPTQAFKRAVQSVNNPVTPHTDVVKEAEKLAIKAADTFTQHNFFMNVLGVKDAPDWLRDRLRIDMTNMAKVNLTSGTLGAEDAVATASKVYKRHYTFTESGQVLFGNRAQIARDMGVAFTTTDASGTKVIDRGDDIDSTLEAYKLQHKEHLLDRMGLTGDLDNVMFDIVPGRGTVIVRDGTDGDVLQGPFPLSELKRGRDAYNDELRRAAEEQARLVERGGDPHEDAGKDAWDVEGLPTPFQFNTPEERPEQVTGFFNAIKGVENSVRHGFNKGAGVWSPHPSVEGGNDTLAFGHKLTNTERDSGIIYIDGKSYPFANGDSLITEAVAERLLEQDLANARTAVSVVWGGYDALPWKYQKVLENLQFNASKTAVTPKSWPDLYKAMKAGDDVGVHREMLTHFENKEGNMVPLQERADAIAMSLGLLKQEGITIAE